MRPADPRFRRYLLGEMDATELNRFEEEYFCNEAAFEALCKAEEELLGEFCRDLLPGSLQARVALCYGVNAERRAKVASAMAEFTEERRIFRLSPGWWRRGLILAALASSVACVILWRSNGRLRDRIDELAMERPTVPAVRTLRSLDVSLQPGLSRSAEATATRVLIPSGTSAMRLHLSVPAGAAQAVYEVSVSSIAGEEIWMERPVRPELTASQAAVIVSIPISVLPHSDYVVRLRARSRVGSYADFLSYQLAISHPQGVR